MKHLQWVALVSMVASGLAAGCMCDDNADSSASSSSGVGGSGHGGGGGAGGGGVGGGAATPVVQAYEADGAEVAADFSCREQWTLPVQGEAISVTLPVLAFGELDDDGMPVSVPGATVKVYPADDTLGGSCNAGCSFGTEVQPGLYQISAPATGWFSYRVEAEGFIPTIENHTYLPAEGQPVWLNLMRRTLLSGFFALLGAQQDTSKSVLSGRALDCAGRPVSGAELRLFNAAGERLSVDEGGYLMAYFDATGLPSGERSWTSPQARWAVANAPAGEPLRIELWGRLEEGSEPVMLGCELAEAYADTLTTLGIFPLRSDAPAACGQP